MKKIEPAPAAHLSICCRVREGKPSCGEKGSKDLVKELKSWIKAEGLKKQVKVTESSCLGFCESGITASLQPKNQWFKDLQSSDVDSLKKMLTKCAK